MSSEHADYISGYAELRDVNGNLKKTLVENGTWYGGITTDKMLFWVDEGDYFYVKWSATGTAQGKSHRIYGTYIYAE